MRFTWWLSPASLTLFVLVPIYVWAASSLETVHKAGLAAPANHITPESFMVGLAGFFALFIGATVGSAIPSRALRLESVSSRTYGYGLRVLGYLSLTAYVLFMAPLATHWDAAVSMLAGNRGASAHLHSVLARVPGITSFMQFSLPFFAGCAVWSKLFAKRLPTDLMVLLWGLVILGLLRAFLASERLALIEVLVALLLPRLLFIRRTSSAAMWLRFAPIYGIVVIFGIFAVFEFFRSWSFYATVFDDFWSFANARFASYFSTSVNNGAGLFSMYGPGNTSLTLSIFGKDSARIGARRKCGR